MYSEKVIPSMKRGHVFREALYNIKNIKITIQDNVKYTVLKGDKVILKADASEIPPPTTTTSSGEVCNSYVSCGNSFSKAFNSDKHTTLDKPDYKPKTGKEYKINRATVIPNNKDLKISDLSKASDYSVQQIYDIIHKEVGMKPLSVISGQENVTLGEIQDNYGINPNILYDKILGEPDTQETGKEEIVEEYIFSIDYSVQDLSKASGKSVQQIYNIIYEEMGMEPARVRPGDEDLTLRYIEDNYLIDSRILYQKIMS